jgi:RHS repeat-associated protein
VVAGGNDLAQQWKYNGIQFNEDLGLNLYDMDLRQYDPSLARWIGVDPITHFNQSTYTAFDNNPVYWADPSGADSESDYDWEAHERGEVGVYKSGSFKNAMANNGLNQDGTKMKKKGEGNCEGCESQTLKDGFGNVEFQQFTSTVKGDKSEFEKFKSTFTASPQEITNNSLATYVPVDLDDSGTLTEGDHIDIDIFGPDNGSVRVAKMIIEDNRFELYFQALEGHPDAGNIRFTGTYSNGSISFEVYNITRVSLGWYSDAYPFGFIISPTLARSAQKTQWRTVMENFSSFMGKPSEYSENIRKFEWDNKNQTIGKEIK